MMKRICFLLCIVVLGVVFIGCDGGGGPTGPTNAPVLSSVTVRPQQGVHPGEIVVFEIQFVDVPGDLNGGTAVITDSQGRTYPPAVVSNAEGTQGTLETFVTLDPRVPPGELHFYISVIDLAGNQSNTVTATIIVV